ncbi:MAG: DUF2065 domain-containing protein [Gammaproteobacteria bacterium]|nr:MAG: DUF2065 domain-containing protein [Gammaproteobacteria bacterium]
MMWQDIFSAIALMLVFEGIMPFISPISYKKTMTEILRQKNSTIRSLGFFIMLAGVILLMLVK